MAAVTKTATATGSVASFWSPKPAAIKSLKVYFEPKQAGEGDPSPDNVRPIEGWSGIEVTHCKEIIPKTGWEVTRSYRTIKIDGDYRFYFKFIEKDSTVELPSNFYFGVALVYPRDGGEVGKGYNWVIDKGAFKAEKSNKITYPAEAVGENGMYLMIYPSTQEAFDAFFAKYEVQMARDTSEPQTYTSSWGSEIGTIYGGYVDLISGQLVQTYDFIKFVGNESWLISGAIENYCAHRPTYLRLIPSFTGPYLKPISNKLSGTAQWATYINQCTLNPNGHFYFGAPEELSTSEAVNAWIQEIGGIDVIRLCR